MSIQSVLSGDSLCHIEIDDVLSGLAKLPDESVHCAITSPPYWNQRDYGVDGQIGAEKTFQGYVCTLVRVFHELKRVLRKDGTFWLNLGDKRIGGQLLGLPWRTALAMQIDGWILRDEIIWCLSGGLKVYARTQKGDMPTTIRDLVRLDPSTVKLWNGERWTQCLGWSETTQPDSPLEIELRSGEKISCTHGHVWPTLRGNVRADKLEIGDVILSASLPDPDVKYSPGHINDNVAWLVGLFLAEGSFDSRGRMQFAGHVNENTARSGRMIGIANDWGGTVRPYESGNSGNIVVDCPPLTAVVKQYLRGTTAKTKGLKNRAWRHDSLWLNALLGGYLAGDGHYDEENKRWRIGFTRNSRLADDMRTLCARLGCALTLKEAYSTAWGKTWPIYRGEIRFERTGHGNERSKTEIVAIGKSRVHRFYDIGVADDPHLFALASGVLTHNSKPDPMPSSVADRTTTAHEQVFLFAKTKSYYYDNVAIMENAIHAGVSRKYHSEKKLARCVGREPSGNEHPDAEPVVVAKKKNRRSVWTIGKQPYKGAHFAVFPPRLVEPCVLAGTSEHGCCAECGEPYRRITNKQRLKRNRPNDYVKRCEHGQENTCANSVAGVNIETVGWEKNCKCETREIKPCVVLDMFSGAATTGLVCQRLGRRYIGIELNPEYVELSLERLKQDREKKCTTPPAAR